MGIRKQGGSIVLPCHSIGSCTPRMPVGRPLAGQAVLYVPLLPPAREGVVADCSWSVDDPEASATDVPSVADASGS